MNGASRRNGPSRMWQVHGGIVKGRANLPRLGGFRLIGIAAQTGWIAMKTEYVLYGLLFLLPLTGLAATLVLGKPFLVLFLTVPLTFHPNPDLRESLLAAHHIGAYGLFAAIGVHAATALIHHYVFHDEVLERMAPWKLRKRAHPAPVVSPAANDNRQAA
jgi:hypothetical protein